MPLNNADQVIGWFKANSSTADDPQLPAIIAKREVALHYLSAADDQISAGNYPEARVKAQEAGRIANETYTDALHLQSTLDTCWRIDIRHPFFQYGIVAVILVVIGIITGFGMWKKMKNN